MLLPPATDSAETLLQAQAPHLRERKPKVTSGRSVIMEKKFTARGRIIAALLAVICLGTTACEKRAETAPGVATPSSQSQPSLEIRTDTAPKTIEPATIGREAGSFASYIHFPKDSEAAKADSAVQFYCDVSAAGAITTRYALIGDNPAFETAVQSALDWGHFNPAKVDGKPVPVYLGGTVFFCIKMESGSLSCRWRRRNENASVDCLTTFNRSFSVVSPIASTTPTPLYGIERHRAQPKSFLK